MTDYPLISIALCTYNGERYLKQQMDSLLAQSYPNLELIISDDASSDKTIAILTSYTHPNIHIYQNERNLGYNKNFEACLEQCTGQYICISDQDDEWEEDKISKLYNAIQTAPMAFSNSALINEKGEPLNSTMSQFLRKPFQSITSPIELVYANIVSGHSMLFNRKLLLTALPVPNGVFYDWWLAFVAATQGNINYLDETLVNHREHDQSAMCLHTETQTKHHKLIKHQELLSRLKCFINAESLNQDDKDTLKKLIMLLKERETKPFSWALFLFLVKHGEGLFIKYRNRSMLNRVNNYIKEAKQIKTYSK